MALLAELDGMLLSAISSNLALRRKSPFPGLPTDVSADMAKVNHGKRQLLGPERGDPHHHESLTAPPKGRRVMRRDRLAMDSRLSASAWLCLLASPKSSTVGRSSAQSNPHVLSARCHR